MFDLFVTIMCLSQWSRRFQKRFAARSVKCCRLKKNPWQLGSPGIFRADILARAPIPEVDSISDSNFHMPFFAGELYSFKNSNFLTREPFGRKVCILQIE